MKRVNISVLLASILLCVIVSAAQAVRAEMSQAREENAMRPVLVKRRDVSSNTKEDSGKMKKLYSNKEIVAFDDEDEQHEQQPILAESPSMSPVLSRQQRTDTHTRKKVAFDRAQKQQQVVSDELIDMLLSELADEEDDDDEISQQYRAKKPSPYQDILPSLDYYEAAEDVEPESESQDLDQLIEDEMKINELVKSLGLKSKSSSNHRVNNDENGEMFIRGGNDNKKIQNSPVNKVQVEEKLMLEKEYNDELKSRLKQQQQQQDDKKDEFFTQEVSLGLLKPTASVAGASGQASMLKQQQTFSHEADPNLSSKIDSLKQQNDYLFMFVVAGCILAGVVALVAAGVCWYTVHKSHKATEAEYGVKIGKFNSKGSVKSTSSSSGDRRLAQSAQMYHYQHQKQQMIAMEKANNDTKPDNSDNSEGETEEGDYTVYECPGLAPTGEMEVKNPLFKEDFSQSLNNINSASTASATAAATANSAASPPPPAYSTIAGEQLVQVSPETTASTQQQQPADSVEHVNEVSPSQPQQ